MISEKMVEKALETMRTKAGELAKAKAERIHCEQFRKSKKALLFNSAPSTCTTIADKENYAYSHPEYIELLDALKIAVEQEEELKWKMAAAEAYVEVWRTQEATNRAIDRAHQ